MEEKEREEPKNYRRAENQEKEQETTEEQETSEERRAQTLPQLLTPPSQWQGNGPGRPLACPYSNEERSDGSEWLFALPTLLRAFGQLISCSRV